MIDVISDAINGKRRLVLDYRPGRRIVEPHTLGIGSSGQLLLRAFQVEGASESGKPTAWKLFRLELADFVENDQSGFAGPREGYRRCDSAMKNGVLAEL
ncbi:hypothetical protein [Gymnodinialimonas sp.]